MVMLTYNYFRHFYCSEVQQTGTQRTKGLFILVCHMNIPIYNLYLISCENTLTHFVMKRISPGKLCFNIYGSVLKGSSLLLLHPSRDKWVRNQF